MQYPDDIPDESLNNNLSRNSNKSPHGWGFQMNAQTHPQSLSQQLSPSAHSLHIQIQLPAHLTKKRALSWVLFAFVSGAIGYQVALNRHSVVGSESSGRITKSAFIAEANAAVEPMSQSFGGLRISHLQTANIALDNSQRTHPDFSLHLDKTLSTLPQAAMAQAAMVSFKASTLPPVQVAQLTPSKSANKTMLDTVVTSEVRLPEAASPVFSETPSSANPQALLNSPAKPLTEAKVRISTHMSADQQAVYHYQQAIAFLQQGRVAEAQDMLKKTLDIYPAHEDARQTLVGLLVDNHQVDEAMSVLKAGLELSPKHISFAQTLARLQLDAGQTEEALNTLQAGAIDINMGGSDAAEYQALLAVVQQKLNHHDAAITHFQLALQHAANSPALLIGLGVSLQMLGRNQEAKASFMQAQQTELNQELAMFVAERIKQVQ